MIRLLSNGYGLVKGSTIGLVDERSEIAAMYKGMPQNDIGIRTDVMNNCQKAVGIRMIVRSMGPSIIATDEIGNDDDVKAVLDATTMGVKLLLTAHGDSKYDIPDLLIKKGIFKNIILLDKEKIPGTIKEIIRNGE